MQEMNTPVVALVAIGYAKINVVHQPGEAFYATEQDAASMVEAGYVMLKADGDAQTASEAEAVLAATEPAAEPVAEPAVEPAVELTPAQKAAATRAANAAKAAEAASSAD